VTQVSVQTDGADTACAGLVRRVAQADADAFGELYRLMSPRVFGLVRKVVIDPAVSEEVTQEIFLEIWSRADSFDGTRGSAPTWIMTMARRRAIDRVRSEAASAERSRAGARANPVAASDSAVEDVPEGDAARRLTAPLGNLTPLQREAIDLAYFGGLTYDETARRLGAASGTVRSRIREGILRLRADLSAT
jgi:RNA polymerase sigma-70 factor (ECF subfamily)